MFLLLMNDVYYERSPSTRCNAPCSAAGTFAPNPNSQRCEQCPMDTYSSVDGTQCVSCSPDGMVCVSGLKSFVSTYWRGWKDLDPSNVTLATVFHAVRSRGVA